MVDPKDKQLRPPIPPQLAAAPAGKGLVQRQAASALAVAPVPLGKTPTGGAPVLCAVLPCHTVVRHLRGEDQILQENKVANLRLAAARLDGIVLRPARPSAIGA